MHIYTCDFPRCVTENERGKGGPSPHMVRGLSAEKNIFLLFTCCPTQKKYFFLSRRCRLCCCLLQRLTYAFTSAALAAVICFVASLLASAALFYSQIFYRSFGILKHCFYICINQNGFAVADSIYIHAVIYRGLFTFALFPRI